MFVIATSMRPFQMKELLLLPMIALCLGIPLIVGIISTAEERNLGLLDWQLTLPLTANRQWFAKVFATFTVNVILGLVLPLSLVGISASWFGMGSFQPQRADEYTPFLIANLAIFCAAIYASSASGNSLRALVGTIVICVVLPVAKIVERRKYFFTFLTLSFLNLLSIILLQTDRYVCLFEPLCSLVPCFRHAVQMSVSTDFRLYILFVNGCLAKQSFKTLSRGGGGSCIRLLPTPT